LKNILTVCTIKQNLPAFSFQPKTKFYPGNIFTLTTFFINQQPHFMRQSAFLTLFLFSFFQFSLSAQGIFSGGDWYKISIEETGMYQITYDDLVAYGIDPGQIDPAHLSIYGNPAGMLSETYNDSSYLGVTEMAIEVVGGEDGIFDVDDYILFYGQDPVIWAYDADVKQYSHQTNYYSDETFYFLSVTDTPGKRVQPQYSTSSPHTSIIDYFDLLVVHENDLENPGRTGKWWLGEKFPEDNKLTFDYDLSDYVYDPYLNYFKTVFAANSTEVSYVNVKVNDTHLTDVKIWQNPTDIHLYRGSTFDTTDVPLTSSPDFVYTYAPANDSSVAWLDYFEFRIKIAPYLKSDQLCFRTAENVGVDSISKFYFIDEQIDELKIWNVSDPFNASVLELQTDVNDHPWFQLETPKILEFAAFNGQGFLQPEFVGQIENQDLESMETPEYLIIIHPDFEDAADMLKDLHSDDLNTTVVTTDEIYNEFSSGAQDVSAIRNFVWFLKEKSNEETSLGYVLLFGDASYDYKDRIAGNNNFVPTFESLYSSNQVNSYATDRFYAMKDMLGQNQEQIAVGRLPVSSMSEANAMVSKIESYTSVNTLGAWKNETMFIADNGDNNRHLNDSEYLTGVTNEDSPVFNMSKTYLDFFELVQTDEGPRYPEVNAEIEQNINDGVFYVNYSGHGSSEVLAQEQVLTIPELAGWDNQNMLPLWVIASVDVARYDDPGQISLGESMLLLDNAGAIAVISNNRPTFASSNLFLNLQVLEKFMDASMQEGLRFGDIFNNPVVNTNDLKWNLLGDPALKIGFPEFLVATLEINGVEVEDFTDTIPPGSTLKLNGQIADKNEQMLQSWFNGNVYLKVYAPPYIRQTLGNQNPVTDVLVQDSILVVATGTVIDGEFELEVTLPALYFEDFGKLKFSWYAENGETDANGFYNGLVFGGEPSDMDEFEQIARLIKVYPSPFNTQIFVELPQLEKGSFTISVYDLMGVQVYSGNAGQVHSQRINLSYLPEGIYLLNVSSPLGSKNMKILKN